MNFSQKIKANYKQAVASRRWEKSKIDGEELVNEIGHWLSSRIGNPETFEEWLILETFENCDNFESIYPFITARLIYEYSPPSASALIKKAAKEVDTSDVDEWVDDLEKETKSVSKARKYFK